MKLVGSLLKNKKLIWELSKNDFRTKYAGSYLGIIWAFVQPVITILVYWFVFQVGFRQSQATEYPYVLVLVTGIIPWFFFADGLNGGSSALLEYNYLVKKIVFNIDILPVIKIMSALFVHGFFVLFTLILTICYGYYPSICTLQVLYYSLCTFVLVLGLSYLTSAIAVFFRDIMQIISIILQVGIWMTPIMWDVATIPARWRWVFRLNPLFYVVNGYREALLYHGWFWDDLAWTAYFWVFAVVVFALGTAVFRRLRPHFADIL
jgi:teichoic acid transport system permease protein